MDATHDRQRCSQQMMQLVRGIEQLREALIGVSERELPGDSLPCFCVDYQRGDHSEWCETARMALIETADLLPGSLSASSSDTEARTGS
jgi:hypothetical protein